jgi:hypothetical protein
MGEKEPRVPRKSHWRWVAIVSGVLFLCAVLFPSMLMALAKNRVGRFCQEIKIGQSINGLEKRALEIGLNVTHRPPLLKTGEDSVPGRLTAWDGWTYARWFCDLKYEDDRVVSKEMFCLD